MECTCLYFTFVSEKTYYLSSEQFRKQYNKYDMLVIIQDVS